MKHTPGPWTQHTPSNPTEAVVIAHELPNYRRTVVAVIPDHKQQGKAAVTDWNEEHANARLIAAAPEMLRALELALIDIENTLRRTFNTDPQTDTTYTIIRNTIRKATGE